MDDGEADVGIRRAYSVVAYKLDRRGWSVALVRNTEHDLCRFFLAVIHKREARRIGGEWRVPGVLQEDLAWADSAEARSRLRAFRVLGEVDSDDDADEDGRHAWAVATRAGWFRSHEGVTHPPDATSTLLDWTTRTRITPPVDVAARSRPPRRLVARIVAERAHSSNSFTQGLLVDRGTLFESTGQHGESALIEHDLMTGHERRRVTLPARYFGEGIAKVGDRILQLTWRQGVAFSWEVTGLRYTAQHCYEGEGWGLACDGQFLFMSDGSSRLMVRDGETFQPLAVIPVTKHGLPCHGLNAMTWARRRLYANVWPGREVVEIDPNTGAVASVIDCSALHARAWHRAPGEIDVLNGIAHDPGTDRFLLTGKYWPILFEVEFVDA